MFACDTSAKDLSSFDQGSKEGLRGNESCAGSLLRDSIVILSKKI